MDSLRFRLDDKPPKRTSPGIETESSESRMMPGQEKAANRPLPPVFHYDDTDNTEHKAENSYASSGAATLALFGGLAGVLVGWIISVSPRQVPGQGTLMGGDVVSTTLIAGLLGAAIGGVIGALWGLSIGKPTLIEDEPKPHEERVVPLDYVSQHIAIPTATPPALAGSGEQAQTEIEWTGVEKETSFDRLAQYSDTAFEETKMRNDSEGQDANNVTGTRDAIDPETGAHGTAGTPMTTGYGVSGSTVGTGSTQVEGEYQEGDFRGTSPDSSAYDTGGRGSDDSDTSVVPDAAATSVTEKYGEGTTSQEAPAQSDPQTRDAYEGGPSYGPDGATGGTGYIEGAQTSQYSGAAVDQPPSYGKVDSESTEASAGTNVEGTAKPRGLGDNTDA